MCSIFLLTACEHYKLNNNISEYTKDVMTNRGVVFFNNDDDNSGDMSNNEAGDEIILNDFNMQNDDEYTERIDCKSVNECDDKIILLKEEFGNIIDNVSYIDVFNQNNTHVGYYLDYTFNDYQYQDVDICMNMGNNLIMRLDKHNLDFTCDDTGFLKVGVAK